MSFAKMSRSTRLTELEALKLSIVYALHGGTFYSDVDAIVTEVAVKRLKTIIPKSEDSHYRP